jgi:DNA invertase Pin-like site-specific DNA recombinase
VTEDAAIYLRVSTEEQDLSGQEREIRSYCEAHGWPVLAVYREKVSATGKVEREEYTRLWEDAHKPDRPWTHLVVWSLDRWSREYKLSWAFSVLEDLEERGIRFHSVKEPFMDSDAPPFERDLVRALLPTIAAFESHRRSERVLTAIKEIREGRRTTRSGLPIGRPRRVTPELEARIHELRREGTPWKKIAQFVGLPAGTCRKHPPPQSTEMGSAANPVPPNSAPPNESVPIPADSKGPLSSEP